MHDTAMRTAAEFFEAYCNGRTEAVVIDIGSEDVNGSLRAVCPGRFKYIGVDLTAGKNVDIVLSDPYVVPIGNETADIVVCSSVFEHSEFFWLLFLEIIRIFKGNGLLYLNVPSNGNFHRYPVDCWRFYRNSGNALARWAQRQS